MKEPEADDGDEILTCKCGNTDDEYEGDYVDADGEAIFVCSECLEKTETAGIKG